MSMYVDYDQYINYLSNDIDYVGRLHDGDLPYFRGDEVFLAVF